MLYITYASGGENYSDFEVEKFINGYEAVDYKKCDTYIDTSTENIIYAVRVAIKEGKLDCDYVVLYFDETTVKFNKDAKPMNGNYPSTYFDYALNKLIGI